MGNFNDLFITDSLDGGELELTQQGNDLSVTSSIHNQVYLALFGGNPDGSKWWGNETIQLPENKFESITQKTLLGGTLSQSTIGDIEHAIEQDLTYLQQWVDVGIEVIWSGINKVDINVTIIENDGTTEVIPLIWIATEKELQIRA